VCSRNIPCRGEGLGGQFQLASLNRRIAAGIDSVAFDINGRPGDCSCRCWGTHQNNRHQKRSDIRAVYARLLVNDACLHRRGGGYERLDRKTEGRVLGRRRPTIQMVSLRGHRHRLKERDLKLPQKPAVGKIDGRRIAWLDPHCALSGENVIEVREISANLDRK
jgi:hypothetical protein